MSDDDRLELPLFEAPKEPESNIDELFDDPRIDAAATEPPAAAEGADDPTLISGHSTSADPALDPSAARESSVPPVVIEPIELETLDMRDAPPTPAPEPPEQPQTLPPPPVPVEAGVGSKFAAGSVDLLVHVAVTALFVAGSAALGVIVGARHLLPLAIALGAFSFVYFVIPLTFWGRTPGMAIVGLQARAEGDLPLTMPQAGRRWLGAVASVATLGLGTLVGIADRVSASRTLKR